MYAAREAARSPDSRAATTIPFFCRTLSRFSAKRRLAQLASRTKGGAR